MRLVIVTQDGVAHDVLDDLEEYNLEKSFARSEVIENVEIVLNRLKAANEKLNA